MLTLLVGLLCNLVPMSGVALMLKPDFLALVILYWCIQEPRLIGVGIAWCVGLVMDVADATVFGSSMGCPSTIGAAPAACQPNIRGKPLDCPVERYSLKPFQ